MNFHFFFVTLSQMKKILRLIVFYVAALKLSAIIIPSITFKSGLRTLLFATLALTVFDYFLKPIAKILFLPINIITLGTLRWIINVIGLYLITVFIRDFYILPYHFPGLAYGGLILPKIKLSLLLTYIIVSFLINLIVSLLRWLCKK